MSERVLLTGATGFLGHYLVAQLNQRGSNVITAGRAGCDITPVAEFELSASFDGGGSFEPPIVLITTPQPGGSKFWGDTVGSFDGEKWTPPQGFVNIDDAVATIKGFQQAEGAPEVPRIDVDPQEPNRLVNINDTFAIILAFQGEVYPHGCPDDPCQDNIANPCP